MTFLIGFAIGWVVTEILRPPPPIEFLPPMRDVSPPTIEEIR